MTTHADSTPGGAAPALEVAGVSSGYGDLRVLRDLSLQVSSGTIEVVLGRNGAGKTTLLSTIAGLIRTWDGTVRLAGEDISRWPAHRRARQGVALVQEGKRVFRQRTVLENVSLGSFNQKLSRRQRRAWCADTLARFPALQGRLADKAGSLSGGQQQMLAIAQALASRPSVLLLDEPSAGLAPAVVADVFAQVRRLRDEGVTVLLVEQLADLALDVADHVSLIDGGVVVRSGPTEQFRDRADIREAYFGGAAR